jgi:hypothetical protein
VVLFQNNVGFWAGGQIEKGQLIFNYLTLVVGCGLVGGSQIVRQKDTVLLWMWYCCKTIMDCGQIGKGQLIFNYPTLVAGCGLVVGSQIVRQKDTLLLWML